MTLWCASRTLFGKWVIATRPAKVVDSLRADMSMDFEVSSPLLSRAQVTAAAGASVVVNFQDTEASDAASQQGAYGAAVTVNPPGSQPWHIQLAGPNWGCNRTTQGQQDIHGAAGCKAAGTWRLLLCQGCCKNVINAQHCAGAYILHSIMDVKCQEIHSQLIQCER